MQPIDIVILILAIGVVVFVVGRSIWAKKHGKSGCGCDCESCSGCSSCHTKKEDENA